ncbi:hypothetical protein Pint_34946 [Pistacia integerrima]|uniref:Uncharacterized protein n=1 Tax=Pistacia integerrima TaxID=434235 RepID=A0ACC0Y3D6_9ROSI|nr:hypothetical protein Pint_34946 [Pistacia integerrima]
MAKKLQQQQQLVAAGAWGSIRSSFHSFVALFVAFLFIAVVFLSQNNMQFMIEDRISSSKNLDLLSNKCNLFSGKWVFDNKSYPLYKEKECTFMSDQLACGKFGRKDLSYQFWRWQPHQCDLPRFNATALLERLRNKRLVFVGDSLNRGQWVSMVCLIDTSIPDPSLKSMHNNGSLITFKAIKYNASIEFYWAPLLVESNSDDSVNHRLPDRIVRVQAIEKHARHWSDADVLVFNSYLWWRRSKMEVLWGSFESSDGIHKEVAMPRVYEMALRTWSDCAEEWGGAEDGNCYSETEPVMKEGYSGGDTGSEIMPLVESVLDGLNRRGLNVQLLNITQLSEYRKEGHPSVYRKQWEPLTENQISNPSSYADCIHWCLPGVPDVWNELLYAYLVHTNLRQIWWLFSLLITMQRWNRKKTHFPLLALALLVFIVCSILYNERSIQQIHEDSDHVHHDQEVPIKYVQPNLVNGAAEVLDRFSKCNSTKKFSGWKIGWGDQRLQSGRRRVSADSESCDVFSGKWVFDNTSHPLYNESQCPYMSDQLACHKHGRSDLRYQYWRWQPHDCNLKRWNATEMWEKLRGKRLMFVGDSLNRGQWISMLCLLQSVIPADKRSITPNAELTIFRAEVNRIEYNATLEFLWAPLLVDSNSDDPVNHRLDERIIRPDSVLKHSSRWEHADILIFNSYLWWRQGPVKLFYNKNYNFHRWTSEETGACEELDGLGAMDLAMNAWADWVSKANLRKKRVFFVTMSPTHLWSREWAPGSEGNCYNEKTPIDKEDYWGSGSDLPTMRMVEEVLGRLSSKVTVLNITQLSEYRKDGHPSIYRKFWETLSPKQLSNPSSYSDCIHWCLPGVPDVWNELLFHFL